VDSLGLPDDCEELTIARMLRDTKMDDSRNRLAVDMYYIVAPLIVERKSDWQDFYVYVILPILGLVKRQQYKEAVSLYKYATVCLVKEYINYGDREVVEEIFSKVFGMTKVPYILKYTSLKTYLNYRIIKWRLHNGILWK
jgi:hypothetical protein